MVFQLEAIGETDTKVDEKESVHQRSSWTMDSPMQPERRPRATHNESVSSPLKVRRPEIDHHEETAAPVTQSTDEGLNDVHIDLFVLADTASAKQELNPILFRIRQQTPEILFLYLSLSV